MVQIKWLDSAKEDLKEIYDFIASDSKKYAKHQILKIKSRTNILKTQPLAGKEVREYGDKLIRELVISHYRIIYRVLSSKTIHIILVHHGAKKIPNIIS